MNTIRPRYVETKNLSWGTITAFMDAARADYYAEHNDYAEICKNMGKAIAYTETAWSMDDLTEWQARELIRMAEQIIEKITP